MSRHLVLHIGLPKTGTTSIQRVLTTKRDDLREEGIFYPRVEEGGVPQFLHKIERGGRAINFWRALMAEIDALPPAARTVILSDEQCSRSFRTTSLIGALHARLADHFTTMQVVVYLRRQDLHAASLFSQRLRVGRVEPPDMASFAEEMAPMHDYDALLGRWAEIFGETAITPRIYERACLPGGDAVRDFLEVCGMDPAWAAQRSSVQTNPSMNLEGQALLLSIGGWLRAQSSTPVDAAEWAALAALATRCCPGRGWRPHQAEAAAYLARFADSNEAVRQRWFATRPALFDMDMRDLPAAPVVFPPHPAPETAYAAIMEALRSAQGRKKASGKAKRKKRRTSKRAESRAPQAEAS